MSIDIKKMVDRFLGWKLPMDFAPDGGISFKPPVNPEWWPVGTHLLNAEQAKAMFEHALADASAAPVSAGLSDDLLRRCEAEVKHVIDCCDNEKVPFAGDETHELLRDILAARALASRLSQRVAEDAKDAERYRVLRDDKYQRQEDDVCVTDDCFNAFFGEGLDAAVDALKARYDAAIAAAPMPEQKEKDNG